MKRKILFTILCIGVLSIGTIVYASFIQMADTSILSDQEMKQISGKTCSSCNEYEKSTCRWYGSPECTTGSSCPTTAPIETDNWVPAVVTYTPPNGMEPYFSGPVYCYRSHYIESDGTQDDYICNTYNPIPPSERYDWSDYWNYCTLYTGEECVKCSTGDVYGGWYIVPGYKCRSAE